MQEETPTPESLPEEPVNSPEPSQTPVPELSENSKKLKVPKKKSSMIILVLLFALIAAGAVWYFVLRKDSNTNATNSQSTNSADSTGSQASGIEGAQVVYYAYSQDEKTQPHDYQLLTKKVTGDGEATIREELESSVSGSTIRKNQVAVATEDYTEQKKGTDVWYSSDSGETYKNILHEDNKSSDGIGYQITSMAFSEDGTSLLVAGLPDQGNNTVREINLSDGKSKDVYASESRGVFLVGYNKSMGQMVFTEGCFNCDGNTESDLLSRDIKAKTNKTLKKVDSYVTTAMSADATKVLVAYGTLDKDAPEEGIGVATKAPYTLEQITLSSGTTTKLLTTDTPISRVTYTADSSDPVYSTQKKMVKFAGGKQITIFESESSEIFNMFYITQDDMVFEVDGKVAHYNTADKAYSTLLDISTDKVTIGVAAQ